MVLKQSRSSGTTKCIFTPYKEMHFQRKLNILSRFRHVDLRQSRQRRKSIDAHEHTSSSPFDSLDKKISDKDIVGIEKGIINANENLNSYGESLQNTLSTDIDTDETSNPQNSFLEHSGYQGTEFPRDGCASEISSQTREAVKCAVHVETGSVDESIECMFVSHLHGSWSETNEPEKFPVTPSKTFDIVAPSILEQSLEKNRSRPRQSSICPCSPQQLKTPEREKRIINASVIHIGTFDPNLSPQEDTPGLACASDASSGSDSVIPLASKRKCSCLVRFSPLLEPSRWPQRPLLLRPTPGSGTRIKGIRFTNQTEYIWDGSRGKLPWSQALCKHWGREQMFSNDDSSNNSCSNCMVIPINNGNELDGETLVADFESDLFDGTILVRIRGADGTTPFPYDDNKGYFSDVNRKYQAVIQGRFKESIPWTECLSGIRLDRPCGKLPSKWMIKSALNVIRFFAPQLDACIDCPNPYSLTPLGSTPQTLIVQKQSANDIVDISHSHSEPVDDAQTLMNKASNSQSAIQRARYRKKAFDKLFTEKDKEFRTNPTYIYTFEFLQHLINFSDLSVEFGSMFGSVPLAEILDGQPIQIRACHKDRKIWSFDVWHEILYQDAVAHDMLLQPKLAPDDI